MPFVRAFLFGFVGYAVYRYYQHAESRQAAALGNQVAAPDGVARYSATAPGAGE